MYKSEKKLSERVSESNRILARYPNYIPVIVETSEKDIATNLLKNKYLVPRDVSISHLIFNIRKNLNTNSSKAVFIFCDNMLVNGTEIMSLIYERYRNNFKKDDPEFSDKFMYIFITYENTFGYTVRL